MQVKRIIADLPVVDIAAAKDFYADYLGLSSEQFNMGWVARFASPSTSAEVQLVTRDASAPDNPALSVLIAPDEIEDAYLEAKRRGYEIVHSLTVEPRGPRRFFVRAPDGTVLNIVAHAD
jgi:predicted enzyme related to lactoylglutathione lyase